MTFQISFKLHSSPLRATTPKYYSSSLPKSRLENRVSYLCIVAWLTLAGLILSPTATKATISVLLSDRTLITQSTAIAVGDVTSMMSYRDHDTRQIFTLVTVSHSEVLKGNLPAGTVTVKLLGGKVGNEHAWIQGSPEFALGEKVLLFLTRHADGTPQVAHLYQGKFTIELDASTGNEVVVRDTQPEGVYLLDPAKSGNGLSPEDVQEEATTAVREWGSFKSLIREVLGTQRMALHAHVDATFLVPALPSQVSVEVIENFSTPFLSRWFEPDDGLPIVMLMKTPGEPSALGQGFDQIRASYDAWSNKLGSSFRFQDGGFTGVGGLFSDDVNSVAFGDPRHQLTSPIACGGILAAAGFYRSFTETRVINDQTFFRILEADVVFNDGWEGCGFYEVFDNLLEVATHEMGHVLGLSHSEDSNATMYRYAHFDGRGNILTPDDLAGLVYLYPNTQISLPSPPVLTGPSGIVQTSSPTFTWVPIAEATLYQLEVSNNASLLFQKWLTPEEVGCANLVNLCSETAVIVFSASSAQWKVRAASAGGIGSWSSPMAMILDLPSQVTLTVQKNGTSTGLVTSSPSGITCGPDCSQTFPYGTVVFLTGTADSEAVVSDWSGDPGCSLGKVTLLSNTTCTVTFTAASSIPVLQNFSTRGRVGADDNPLIGGFIIEGNDPKTVLIRARGPSLGEIPFNLQGTLSDPTIQLYSGLSVIAQNDNWQTTDPLCRAPASGCGAAADISATGLHPCQPNPGQVSPPNGCKFESAVLVTLNPGSYTTIIRGNGGGTGLGLLEVIEAPGNLSASTLTNVSTRGDVGVDDNILIGGFIISNQPKTLLIRGRGQSMGNSPFHISGVLANPTILLFSGSTLIAQNDDWQSTDSLCLNPAMTCGTAADISATGLDPCTPNPGQSSAPSGCNLESTLLVTLPPGAYTTFLRGKGIGTGIGLMEVIETNALTSQAVESVTLTKATTELRLSLPSGTPCGSLPCLGQSENVLETVRPFKSSPNSLPTYTIPTERLFPQSSILTVDIAGTGGGMVISDPPGITCGTSATCATSFTNGSMITLTAKPATDSEFIRFSGDSDCWDGSVTLGRGTACTGLFRKRFDETK